MAMPIPPLLIALGSTSQIMPTMEGNIPVNNTLDFLTRRIICASTYLMIRMRCCRGLGLFAENKDEEFAMRLQENECLVHHEKIELDKICPMLPRSITPPLTFGEVVLRGTLSQYTAGGGESACTSIALVAAKHLLVNCEGHADPLEYTDATVLDAIIETGVARAGMAAPGHSNLEDIWSLPVFEDTVESLKHGQRVEDRVGFEGFNRAIEQAWAFAVDEELKSKAVAVIITKPPVTLLCFSCTGNVWYLLDSHGENYATNKVAYFMRFKSTMNLALELEGKFPSFTRCRARLEPCHVQFLRSDTDSRSSVRKRIYCPK